MVWGAVWVTSCCPLRQNLMAGLAGPDQGEWVGGHHRRSDRLGEAGVWAAPAGRVADGVRPLVGPEMRGWAPAPGRRGGAGSESRGAVPGGVGRSARP